MRVLPVSFFFQKEILVDIGHPIYRQEPTRADKNRQEPTRGILCIFRLKYYLLDHIYTLYIQISYMIAFAAHKTMNLRHSKLPW